ncbi:MAG TPA: hypothetical protein VK177_20755 [Flavobacteriales bacterium]|nr:hypothetical protein [Flavobacteriales bacterium]
MNKLFIARALLVIILFTIGACNVTKRKYRKGFYRHKHEKVQRQAAAGKQDLASTSPGTDTLVNTIVYIDSAEQTNPVVTAPVTPVNDVEEETFSTAETNHKKNQPHISKNQQRNYKRAHEQYSLNEDTYKQVKRKKGMWWQLHGKKILFTFLILLAVAAAIIILFSFPLTLPTLSWAWFALSFAGAGFVPEISEAVDNKAVLYLLGLLAFNVPVPLAFFVRFAFTLNINVFLLVVMLYAALVVAAALVALAFDPELAGGIFSSGIMLGIVLGILALLVILMVQLFMNFSILAAVGIVLIVAALVLFFAVLFVAMTFSR